jgi:hypothetical protein
MRRGIPTTATRPHRAIFAPFPENEETREVGDMLRTRKSWIALATCGLLAATATMATAANETVTTTVKVPKTAKAGKTTSGQSKVVWSFTIKNPNDAGSRAANLSSGDLTLPKATFADPSGFKACPLAKLEANDDKSCPAKSVVGKAASHIYSSPVREEPYAVTGVVYYTGMKGKSPQFATFWTLVEIPSAHSVTPLSVSRSGATSKIHFDQPKIPTAPGLPDATVLDIAWTFDGKGSKGLVFRQAKPCKKGTSVAAKYGFYDGSSTNNTAKAC